MIFFSVISLKNSKKKAILISVTMATKFKIASPNIILITIQPRMSSIYFIINENPLIYYKGRSVVASFTSFFKIILQNFKSLCVYLCICVYIYIYILCIYIMYIYYIYTYICILCICIYIYTYMII